MVNNLKIYYQNVRGLKSSAKAKEFRAKLLASFYDVILLCETWLRADIFTAELFDDRYNVYRKDRDNASIGKDDGGGCLIAVRRNLCSRRVDSYELETDVWVSVDHVSGSKTFFNVKYIELRSSFIAYKSHFDKIVENVMSSNVNDSFILTGDYNLGDSVTWSYDSVSGECMSSDVRGLIPNELLDVLSLCNLNQVNVTRNVRDRTLDLVITNLQPNRVTIERSDDPLVWIDGHHPPICVDANLSQVKFLAEKRPPKVNFYKANYVQLERDLERVNWTVELDGLDVDEAVSKFYSILERFIETIPKTFDLNRDYPAFFSYDLIALIRKKEAVRQRLKRERCPLNKEKLKLEFSALRKSVKSVIGLCFDGYVKDCEEKIKTNTKCFFAFTKSLKKTNSLPNSMKLEDDEASDKLSICNMFAKYFSSVYNPIIEPVVEVIYDPFGHQLPPCTGLNELSFTPNEVESVLRGFDKNKVASPDCIPMMFFMKLSMSLSLPLCILFNKSLAESKFPSKWKAGFVSPIFKEGDKNNVTNYRPVSILCAISKVFERLVFNKLFESVRSNIHHSQHGFIKKRSTQTNLMEYVSMVADAMVAGGQVDTVYTDFAKAFDKVDHDKMLFKLRTFGIPENLVQWFSTYLRDRTQFVVIGDSKSDRITPPSGVPQGSILGPLLFIIFINDLLASLSSCSGFADDLKLYKEISSTYDCELLQGDLSKVVEWCRENNMVINVNKCAVMSSTHSRNKIIYPYNIGDEVIKRVSTKKDLGVLLDDKLSFNEHVDDITRKAYRTLGFIFRCGKYFYNQSSMRLLYLSLVRSRLEYCSTVWNPFYAKASDQLERVQKKFSRMYYFKFGIAHPRPPYDTRLKFLKLHSLESRRIENDEIMLYKLMHNAVDSTLSQRVFLHHPTRSTRQSSVFYLPKMVTNFQENAPIYRIQLNHDVYFNNLDIVGTRPSSFINSVRGHFAW